MKKIFLLLLFSPVINLTAQEGTRIISGPMLGHAGLRTAEVWAEFAPEIKEAALVYHSESENRDSLITLELPGGEFNTGLFVVTGLEPGNKYSYNIIAGEDAVPAAEGMFTTQQLWQWRQPAPDFSFLTGSCAYFNQPKYDRPGKPYGGDSTIFEAMAKENASFTLWLGDNWYTREADYYSKWGLYYRASHDRRLAVLQPLLKKMPQYAIWDDHDYGPNDSDKSYILKETSLNIFKKYWANPSYGFNDQGIYTKVTWNDVDIFLLDDRWFRSNDSFPDSIDGKPNPDKKMLGDAQMEWLKNSLLFSKGNRNISFRIIANGSQVLNGYSPYDCLRHFPAEYNELLKFIEKNNIPGVLFLSGDRHHSEIIRQNREGTYPLYDITVSPFTSGIGYTYGAEKNNPTRVDKEIDQQNYARFRFEGKGKDRTLTVTFKGLHGEKIQTWSIKKSELEP